MYRIAITTLLLLSLPCTAIAASPFADASAAVCIAYAAVQADQLPLVVPSETETKPAGPISYKDAHALYKSELKPMVVMVTASWCPYCPAMKRDLLELQDKGGFGDASLVIVDHDEDRATAREVMGIRRTLPALSVYYYRDGKAAERRPTAAEQVPAILKQSNRLAPPSVSVTPAAPAKTIQVSTPVRSMPIRRVRSCSTCG